MLHTNPTSHICTVNIFSHNVNCLPTLISFNKSKFKNVNTLSFSTFSAFYVPSKKSFDYLRFMNTLLYFLIEMLHI